MLAAIGVRSLDDLFADVPAGLRLDRPLALPDGERVAQVGVLVGVDRKQAAERDGLHVAVAGQGGRLGARGG